jgi:hypothetical protein
MAKKRAGRRKTKRAAPAKPVFRGPPHRTHVRTGIDENFENFIEEIAEHGRRVKGHHERTKDWWFGTFGIVGPLFAAAIGTVGVAILAWVISLVNVAANAPFLSMLTAFLYGNLPFFLFIFLVVNYLKHVYFSQRRLYYVLKPVKVAFEITVAFWVLGSVMYFAGMQMANMSLLAGSGLMLDSLGGVFVVFLVIGYFGAIIARGREVYG